jgi:arylsulfatase A-like enzyme
MIHWLEQSDGTQIHVTKKNEKDAVGFLRMRPIDRPFCLTLAFVATHAEDRHPQQFLPQPESLALYNDVTVPLPVTATEDHFRRLPPFIANEKNEGRNRWHWRFDEPEKYQTMMKNYYRLATEADGVCGRVIDELRRQGVLDNTLVIFTTDNGYFHGEHGLADKWYPYEESIRVPLIVWDPRMPKEKRNTTEDRMTLNVDLAPTILAAAGITAPHDMQGRDVAVLYTAEEPTVWRTEFFYEHPTIDSIDFIPSSEALVRRDTKYIYWPDFKYEELFDLMEDPREEHSLAGSHGYASSLGDLRRRLAGLRSAAN